MNSFSNIKAILLLIGDITILYISLIITLLLRYNNLFYSELFDYHLRPFTVLFILWLLVFYIAGLYDLKHLKNDFRFKKLFWSAIICNALIGTIFFYLAESVTIAPKTNLVLFLLIFGVIDYFGRQLFNNLIGTRNASSRMLIIGSNNTAEEIVAVIDRNPQLGYEIKHWMKEGLRDKEFRHLTEIIQEYHINTIIIPAHIKKDQKAASLIYKTLTLDIEVLEMATLYELIFRKIPLAELEEAWFLENLVKKHKIYDSIKRQLEIIASFALSILLSPFLFLIAIIIKLTSSGPVIFKQIRIGKREKEFTIYKFRTMPVDAEKNGPAWANYHQDRRATPFGSLLRKTHLDELPQLFNILKGELSFTGPRPERPEFVQQLRKEIPYYDLRHLAKPGVTGWAQINYRYAASTLDAYQKLQYDLYYIKNHSPFLDLVTIVKTLKFLITNNP